MPPPSTHPFSVLDIQEQLTALLAKLRSQLEHYQAQWPEGLPVDPPQMFLDEYLPMFADAVGPNFAQTALLSTYNELRSGHPGYNKRALGLG